MPVGKRVTKAHLDHFCPGGAGLPVTDSGPIGLGPAGDPPLGDPLPGSEANTARSASKPCARCQNPITPPRTPTAASPAPGSTKPARPVPPAALTLPPALSLLPTLTLLPALTLLPELTLRPPSPFRADPPARSVSPGAAVNTLPTANQL